MIAPLGGRSVPPKALISTSVLPLSTNPMFGLPNYPPTHGTGPSGHALVSYEPPYIRGLGPNHGPWYYDYSGPYSDDASSDSEDQDRAPEKATPKQRACEACSQDPPMDHHKPSQKESRTHEAEIQRLKEDIAREQQRQNRPPPTTREIPVVDLERPSRRQRRAEIPRGETTRTEIPRGDPKDLMMLGDPDDPTPPFTEEVMRAHIFQEV